MRVSLKALLAISGTLIASTITNASNLQKPLPTNTTFPNSTSSDYYSNIPTIQLPTIRKDTLQNTTFPNSTSSDYYSIIPTIQFRYPAGNMPFQFTSSAFTPFRFPYHEYRNFDYRINNDILVPSTPTKFYEQSSSHEEVLTSNNEIDEVSPAKTENISDAESLKRVCSDLNKAPDNEIVRQIFALTKCICPTCDDTQSILDPTKNIMNTVSQKENPESLTILKVKDKAVFGNDYGYEILKPANLNGNLPRRNALNKLAIVLLFKNVLRSGKVAIRNKNQTQEFTFDKDSPEIRKLDDKLKTILRSYVVGIQDRIKEIFEEQNQVHMGFARKFYAGSVNLGSLAKDIKWGFKVSDSDADIPETYGDMVELKFKPLLEQPDPKSRPNAGTRTMELDEEKEKTELSQQRIYDDFELLLKSYIELSKRENDFETELVNFASAFGKMKKNTGSKSPFGKLLKRILVVKQRRTEDNTEDNLDIRRQDVPLHQQKTLNKKHKRAMGKKHIKKMKKVTALPVKTKQYRNEHKSKNNNKQYEVGIIDLRPKNFNKGQH